MAAGFRRLSLHRFHDQLNFWTDRCADPATLGEITCDDANLHLPNDRGGVDFAGRRRALSARTFRKWPVRAEIGLTRRLTIRSLAPDQDEDSRHERENAQ